MAPNCSAVGNIPALGSVCQYTYGAYDHTKNVGVLALPTCNPNGAAVGPQTDMIGSNIMLGCTVGNNANNASQLVYNTQTTNFTNVGNITGSDEVWFNSSPISQASDGHYYTGSSANIAQFGGPSLGIIDAQSNILVSTIPIRERLAFGRSRPDPRSPVHLCPASGSANAEQHGAAGCRRRRQYRCQQANLRRQQRLHSGLRLHPRAKHRLIGVPAGAGLVPASPPSKGQWVISIVTAHPIPAHRGMPRELRALDPGSLVTLTGARAWLKRYPTLFGFFGWTVTPFSRGSHDQD